MCFAGLLPVAQSCKDLDNDLVNDALLLLWACAHAFYSQITQMSQCTHVLEDDDLALVSRDLGNVVTMCMHVSEGMVLECTCMYQRGPWSWNAHACIRGAHGPGAHCWSVHCTWCTGTHCGQSHCMRSAKYYQKKPAVASCLN